MTTRVRLVATNRPNSSDTASAAKMGSSRMKSAPAAMAATAVSAMGVARTTADSMIARANGIPSRTWEDHPSGSRSPGGCPRRGACSARIEQTSLYRDRGWTQCVPSGTKTALARHQFTLAIVSQRWSFLEVSEPAALLLARASSAACALAPRCRPVVVALSRPWPSVVIHDSGVP